MKAAISVPGDNFDRASARARDLGMSRSEFFARAAQHYLAALDAESLTVEIDTALAHLESANDSADDSVDDAVMAGHRVLAGIAEEW